MLRRNIHRHLLFLTFFWCCLLVAGHPQEAFAQEVASASSPMNLTLTPVSMFLESKPGATTTAQMRVRNNSEKAEHLQIHFGTFAPDESGDHPKLITPDPQDESMRWISAAPNDFVVNPGEWQDITVTFSPSTNAALSYYYSILFQRPTLTNKPGETVIQGSPAVLALANVESPNAVRQVELLNFRTQSAVVEYLPQSFSIQMKNSGNVHLIPAGNIFIDGQGKTDIAVLSVNPKLLTVLPNSTRTFEVSWNDGFPVQETIDTTSQNGLHLLSSFWDFSKADRFRFGRYTAHLLLVYDNGQRDVPIESFVTFWVIPWKILLVGFAVSVLILIGLRSLLLFIVHLVRPEKASQKPSSSSL